MKDDVAVHKSYRMEFSILPFFVQKKIANFFSKIKRVRDISQRSWYNTLGGPFDL